MKATRIPVHKHPGIYALVDEAAWKKYTELKFSESISLDSNGRGQFYPKTMAYLPDPTRRSVTMPLARILVAIHRKMCGLPLDGNGWTVRCKNGDRLDLRSENLEVVPARGQRNSFNACWAVNDRWRIFEAGGNPKEEIRLARALHRAAKKCATHKSESVQTPTLNSPRAPGQQPHPAASEKASPREEL